MNVSKAGERYTLNRHHIHCIGNNIEYCLPENDPICMWHSERLSQIKMDRDTLRLSQHLNDHLEFFQQGKNIYVATCRLCIETLDLQIGQFITSSIGLLK